MCCSKLLNEAGLWEDMPFSGIKMEFELGLGLAMEFAFGSEARNCCVVEEVGGGDSSVEVSASSTTISRRTTGQYIETLPSSTDFKK